MSQYVTAVEYLNSVYGADSQPGESIFETTSQVDDFLVFISSLIDTYCGRTFVPARYEQIVEGYGQSAFFLETLPVTGVVSFVFQNLSGSSSGAMSNQYMLDKKTGRIKLSTPLSSGLYYKVVYDAGYVDIPDAIKTATMMLAHTYAQAIETGSVGVADGGAVTSFKFAKFAEAYSDPRQRNPQYDQGIPVTVEAILRKYRYMR